MTIFTSTDYCQISVQYRPYNEMRTTSLFSENTPSLMFSGAIHLMGSLTLSSLHCRKYSLVISMLSDNPKSATLITKLESILKKAYKMNGINQEGNFTGALLYNIILVYYQITSSRYQNFTCSSQLLGLCESVVCWQDTPSLWPLGCTCQSASSAIQPG